MAFGVTLSISSGYHPQSQGQKERMNQTLEKSQVRGSLTPCHLEHRRTRPGLTAALGYQQLLPGGGSSGVMGPGAPDLQLYGREWMRVYPKFHVLRVRPVTESDLAAPVNDPPSTW